MANEELLTDLKQFVEVTVSQQLSSFVTKDDIAQLATKEDVARVEQRLNEHTDLLDEKLDTIQEAITDVERLGRVYPVIGVSGVVDQ